VADLFVGLVTHPRSRFNADGAATRRAEALVTALSDRGVSCELLVSDRDDYDPSALPLDTTDLRRSAAYQADLEYRWRRYLADGGGTPARPALVDVAMRVAMSVKRVATVSLEADVRLLNIDLSHLRVLESGASSGAPWTLVLEDDARAADAGRAAADLAALVGLDPADPLQFANLSESIPLDRLGVQGIVTSHSRDGLPWLVATTRPVTNTVCANLYRSPFAARLASGIRARGLVPVAPIDWRLNEQVMDLYEGGVLGAESCAWARPGVFLQGSMHGTG
jgi:hypothetical protein